VLSVALFLFGNTVAQDPSLAICHTDPPQLACCAPCPQRSQQPPIPNKRQRLRRLPQRLVHSDHMGCRACRSPTLPSPATAHPSPSCLQSQPHAPHRRPSCPYPRPSSTPAMLHSSPVQLTAFARSSTSRQQIQTWPLSCSRPAVMLAATAPLKTSISPSSQPTQVFAIVTMLFLWAPALVVWMNHCCACARIGQQPQPLA